MHLQNPLFAAGSVMSSGPLPAYPQNQTTPSGPTILVAVGTTAAELQELINTAAAGTVLNLAAGHHAFDRTIQIDRSDISVIGAGSGKTFIDVPSALGEAAIQIGSGQMRGDFALAADVAEGGKVMTLTGSHSFVVGDHVYLARDSTAAFYDDIGDTAWRNTDVALRTSIARVVAVDGSRITLASGVHFDFTPGETTVREISMVENVTVGGFTVDYGLGSADPSDFANRLSMYDRNAVVEVDGTAGLHLFDIAAHDVPSIGVNFASSIGISADRLTMTGAHNKGDGGNGYGVQIRDVYDSSFTNIVDADMRHSVVFASWTSAVGNKVHVRLTDRDINFHGGRDHDNVVTVDESLRDANSDIIAPTLFVNTGGTHYGTVTDAGANTVTFGKVVGTRLNDAVTGRDTGAWLDGRGGHDSLTGGAGNDVLIGGAGNDALTGAGGTDIAQYLGNMADFTITQTETGSFDVRDRVGGQGTDRLTSMEWVLFADKALRLADLSVHATSAVDGLFSPGTTPDIPTTPTQPTTEPPTTPLTPSALLGTDGKDVFTVTQIGTTVSGLGNWDTVRSTVDFIMSADVERLDLTGTAEIDGTGSANTDHIHGNDAANTLLGLGGADRLWGQDGNDQIYGGAGNDRLTGDGGADLLDGGAGQDKLKGGAGADVFVFAAASDSERRHGDRVLDFQSGEDRIDLRQIDANTALSGNQAFVWGTSAAGDASLWMKGVYLYGDVDNDGVADLAILITGKLAQSDVWL